MLAAQAECQRPCSGGGGGRVHERNNVQENRSCLNKGSEEKSAAFVSIAFTSVSCPSANSEPDGDAASARGACFPDKGFKFEPKGSQRQRERVVAVACSDRV